MKALLLILSAIAASAGCCKDRVLNKPSGPKIEEYPLPPDSRMK